MSIEVRPPRSDVGWARSRLAEQVPEPERSRTRRWRRPHDRTSESTGTGLRCHAGLVRATTRGGGTRERCDMGAPSRGRGRAIGRPGAPITKDSPKGTTMHVTSTVRHDDSLLVLLVERSFVLGEIPGISLDAGIGWLDACSIDPAGPARWVGADVSAASAAGTSVCPRRIRHRCCRAARQRNTAPDRGIRTGPRGPPCGGDGRCNAGRRADRSADPAAGGPSSSGMAVGARHAA